MCLKKYLIGRCLRVHKKYWAIVCLVCAIGLTGCQGKSEKEQGLDMKENQLEQKIEDLQNPVSYEGHLQPVINMIDPNTLEIVHTLSPQNLEYETDHELYKKKIEQFAQDLARGTEIEPGYDKRMVLDRVDENGQIIKGSPMIVLKESELVEKILAASESGGDIQLPLYLTESGYSFEDLPYLEEVVVASYTTHFNPADAGRNKNIELSAKAIHNVIVGSGDYFSFNTVVGPRDEENGYQPAPEIINKKIVMGIGGGICQTSSTLFNALDQLPIKFVERHHHSLDIGYVPKGRDATVAYGSLDFRFQNSNDVPFLIQAIYGKDFLTIEVRTAEKYATLLKKTP